MLTRFWLRLAVASALAVVASCAREAPQAAARTDPADGPATSANPLGNYLAGIEAEHSHDYVSAVGFMDRALKSDPDNLPLVRRAFLLRVSDGKVADSVPLARRLVAADGNNGLPALVLLVEDLKASAYDDAATRARVIERTGPQRFAAPLLDAWIEAGRKDGAAARRALQEMGDLQGLEPLRDLHLGMIDDFLGDIDGAQHAFDKLLSETSGPSYRIAEMTGNFYERRGRSEDAKKLYARFAANGGDNGLTRAGLARIATGTLPPPVVRSAPQGAAYALFDLASVLNQQETADASLLYARLALELDPKLALAQLLLGEIRDAQGRTEDALVLDQAVERQSPLYETAQLRAAAELDTLGRTDEALRTLKAMLAADPGDEEALLEEGDILRGHDRYAEAAQFYDQAVRRAPKGMPDEWRLYYDRGVALERSGDWPKAEADLERALQLSPDQPLVLNYLGYSWIDKGQNLSKALAMVQHAVELSPNDGYMIDSLGWAYYRLGDYAKALDYLERAIDLLPEDPTINDHLGDAYWRSGRQREARYQWQRALQFGPDESDKKSIETKLDRGLAKPQTVRGG